MQASGSSVEPPVECGESVGASTRPRSAPWDPERAAAVPKYNYCRVNQERRQGAFGAQVGAHGHVLTQLRSWNDGGAPRRALRIRRSGSGLAKWIRSHNHGWVTKY